MSWGFIFVALWAIFVGRAANVVPLSALLNCCRSSRRAGSARSAAVGHTVTHGSKGRDAIPAKSQFLIWCATTPQCTVRMLSWRSLLLPAMPKAPFSFVMAPLLCLLGLRSCRFAGLRGAIAYGLAKQWREEESVEHVVSSVMVIVVFTTFGTFAAPRAPGGPLEHLHAPECQCDSACAHTQRMSEITWCPQRSGVHSVVVSTAYVVSTTVHCSSMPIATGRLLRG